MTKIGVAYTVHNRNDVAAKAIERTKKLLPKGAKLVIVDDGSTIPFKGATYRFETNAGIPKAKNKCLELLDDCSDIFLFDDDTWAISRDWYKPYIESDQPHLMFTFDTLKNGRPNGNRQVLSTNGHVQYANPCGCMLYFKRHVLDKVGGFDVKFEKYFFEHVELSRRIYNAGLTKHPFQDVVNSIDLFYSMDWAQDIVSSVQKDRGRLLHNNRRYYQSQMRSTEYKPYKPIPNYVLTCLFKSVIDPQRGVKWDIENTDILEASLPDDVVFKCFTDAKIDNPYFARWVAYRDFLRTVDPNSFVWAVDGTDVDMLRNPFNEMKRDVLYVGCEHGQTTGSSWLVNHHPNPMYTDMYKGRLPLLNAGLVGGTARMVLAFCELMAISKVEYTDMAVFNYIAHRHFSKRVCYGSQVNTVFKKYEQKQNIRGNLPWWRHK